MVGVLDIVALRSLTSIADTGGFRRAADCLHLSQSAVSQHVRRLELACGRPLVERHGRGTQFTADGELLIAEARKILAAHDDALERICVRPTAADTLVIGATEHAADLLLPSITARLQHSHPQHSVRFRIDRGAQLVERLEDGVVDAALLLGEASGERTRPAGSLPLAWYSAPGRTPAHRPGDTVPLVVIDGPCTIRRRALQVLAENAIESTVVCEAGHLAGVVNATRAGVGVALLARLGTGPDGLAQVHGLPFVAAQPMHVRGRPGVSTTLLDTVAGAALDLLG